MSQSVVRPDSGGTSPSAPEDLRDHAREASRLLRTLGNPNRLMILCLLAEDEMSVGEINARIPLSQSALSQHLAVLRQDGLVTTRRESQSIHYRIVDGNARRVIALLHDLYCPADSDV